MKEKCSTVYGIGINDFDGRVKVNGKIVKSYDVWHSMIERCYSNKSKEKRPTYIGCRVHKEWLSYSAFKEWFDSNYIDGYQLDKDILFKGNKIYCTDTCCFVPREINILFVKHDAKRGECPIGVCYCKGRFRADISVNGQRKNIGIFDNKENAFNAYKEAKENQIKSMAIKYYSNGLISLNVYNSMIKYKVSITD